MIVFNKYPYCNCWETGKFMRQDGYTLDHPSGLWVHSRCRKPSKMNYERMVTGKDIIPQYRGELDIYEYERTYEFRQLAKKIIAEELGWDDDPENDYYYDD